MGGGGVGGGRGGWVAEGGPKPPPGHRQQYCVLSDRNRLNPWDKSRQSLAAVYMWYHSHPY